MVKPIVVSSVAIVLLAASLLAKGDSTKITLRDAVLQTSVDITDPSVLKDFNVWAGPGTYLNGVEGTQGFIVEWPAGIASDRPNGLRRYEVTFYVRARDSSAEDAAYFVLYEHDPLSGRGFVYLPGRSDEYYGSNVRAIFRHGLEGHWFHASARWQAAVERVLAVR